MLNLYSLSIPILPLIRISHLTHNLTHIVTRMSIDVVYLIRINTCRLSIFGTIVCPNYRNRCYVQRPNTAFSL